jgi:hypothetical protein
MALRIAAEGQTVVVTQSRPWQRAIVSLIVIAGLAGGFIAYAVGRVMSTMTLTCERAAGRCTIVDELNHSQWELPLADLVAVEQPSERSGYGPLGADTVATVLLRRAHGVFYLCRGLADDAATTPTFAPAADAVRAFLADAGQAKLTASCRVRVGTGSWRGPAALAALSLPGIAIVVLLFLPFLLEIRTVFDRSTGEVTSTRRRFFRRRMVARKLSDLVSVLVRTRVGPRGTRIPEAFALFSGGEELHLFTGIFITEETVRKRANELGRLVLR